VGDQRGIECERDGRQLGGRIGVSDRSAHGAAVADLEVSDVRQSGGQQRHIAGNGGVVFGRRLAHKRAHAHVSVVAFDRVETGDPVEVDEVPEGRESQRHHRDQALPAGQHLGLVAVLAEQRDRFAHARRRVVLESSWLHTTSRVPDGDRLTGSLIRTVFPSSIGVQMAALC
jgi:hypothetical protein